MDARRMVIVVLSAVCAVLLVGCGKEEAVYQGKPTSFWVKQLNDKDRNTQLIAADALIKIGPEAVPALIKVLQNKNNNGRAAAALALGAIKTQAKERIPSLIEALQDPDEEVYTNAAEALWILVPEEVEVYRKYLKPPFLKLREVTVAPFAGKECRIYGVIQSIEHVVDPLTFTIHSNKSPDVNLVVETNLRPPRDFRIGKKAAMEGTYHPAAKKFFAREISTLLSSREEELWSKLSKEN